MGICQQIAEASSGFFQSPIVQGLGQVLGALGAADIAIRIGSGGQVGLTDLPELANTAGIPCYSPELGDTIYVTPSQWYGNGMSCDGLRDVNRERIQQQIQEYQDRMDARNRIQRRGFDPPPMNSENLRELERLLPNLPDSGFSGGNGVEFLESGTLDISSRRGVAGFNRFASYGFAGDTNRFGSQGEPELRKIKIYAGMKIRRFGSDFTNTINYFDEIERTNFSNTESRATHYFYLVSATGAIISAALFGISYSSFSTTARPSSRFSYQSLGHFGSSHTKAEKFDFTPDSPPTSISNGGGGQNIPINPPPPPTPPKETPCMGGCSCGQMANQNQRQNSQIEKMIKEIHKALGADRFASGNYSFSPEQVIETQGKTIYRQNPGRGGSVRVSNILEAVTAAISAHYHRSGLHRFPAKVPDSLIPNSNDTVEALDRDEITLYDAMAWQKWWFEQWEAVTGEYPLKYEITDDGKTKPVRLWNQSEVLAEMFGMMCKIQEDADLGVQWGVRAATEASKSGNAALKNLHLLQEYVKWSGCLTSNGATDFIKVTSTFSPDPDADPSKAEEMLKPSKQDLQVTNIVDGRSLLSILMNINYWAQISGRANFGDMGGANPLVQTPGQNMNMPGDGIKEMRKKERAQNKIWDKWKQQQEAPSTIPQAQQPPGGIPTSKIIEIEQKKK